MVIHLSKVSSDLKQNRTLEKTPFYWSVFYVMCLFCSMYQLKMLNVIIHQQQPSFFIRIGKRLDKLRRTTMYFLMFHLVLGHLYLWNDGGKYLSTF